MGTYYNLKFKRIFMTRKESHYCWVKIVYFLRQRLS